MAMVPVLFIAGVAFGYFVALPRAVDFLQNFNDDQFDILDPGRGLLPVRRAPPGADRAVVPDPGRRARCDADWGSSARASWRHNRGYVILGISVVAAVATPTPDPVTMLIAMAPAGRPLRAQHRAGVIFRPAAVARRWDAAGTTTRTRTRTSTTTSARRRLRRRPCPYPDRDAVRPSRPRPPAHRPGDLPRPRHPHGRRPRAVRDRRRHERRSVRRDQRQRRAVDQRRHARSRSASRR